MGSSWSVTMGSERSVTPEEAARSLAKELRHEPWLLTVGSGREFSGGTVLFVYAKSLRAARRKRLSQWKGYKVQVKPLNPRPAKMNPRPAT